VGGLDISFSVEDPSVAISYLTVLEYPSLKVLYEDWEQVHVDIPYIPGFLAFRELPFCLKLIERIKLKNADLMP
jgi:deoxyinosine 3'endonuclease (endonuclease V)